MSEYCKNCYELQEKYDKMVKISEENLIKYEDLRLKTLPFNDEYFNGLTYEQIAELAKKSIRVTAYNRELEHALEEIKEIVKSVKTEYEKVKDNPLALYHTEINGAYSVAKSILSKISEVENER